MNRNIYPSGSTRNKSDHGSAAGHYDRPMKRGMLLLAVGLGLAGCGSTRTVVQTVTGATRTVTEPTRTVAGPT